MILKLKLAIMNASLSVLIKIHYKKLSSKDLQLINNLY